MRNSKNGFPAVPMRLILLCLSLMIAATAHAAPLRGKVTGIVVEKEKRIMTRLQRAQGTENLSDRTRRQSVGPQGTGRRFTHT
jgi:hypothetical protein